MSKYLVIVESPTKAKTISSILGKDYEVTSSMGHIVDLPLKRLSVDVENDFTPSYKVIKGKEKIIAQLKKKSEGKTRIYLATDLDREGEAISWHIQNQLLNHKPSKRKKSKKTPSSCQPEQIFYRVVFHEITEDALKTAFSHPIDLNLDKVNAQIARRVLDRLVGYSLSPLLWKKIVRGLSAGRVQSVALKFIVEREKEINAFIPKTTYSIAAEFKSGNITFTAKLSKYKNEKIIFESREQAAKCIENIKNETFSVTKVTGKVTKRKPLPPYTTSLLQQDAFSKLRFSSQKTMLLAQKLYEGAQIEDKITGLITYMRTDSFHISPKAKNEAKEFIRNTFGEDYLPEKDHHYKEKKGAQLAHEAIRPTSIYLRPESMEQTLSPEEIRLYNLIWMRFICSLMSEACYENTKALINSRTSEFTAEGRKLTFEGFLKIWRNPEEQEEIIPLPELKNGDDLRLENFKIVEHITKPPPHFNDASLVKLLEEKGIGRPSTYAPTLYTLLRRNYINREKGYFVPTDLGEKVALLLIENFPEIMNENFTAGMEKKLDEIEEGKIEWKKVLRDFYPSFKEKVDQTAEKIVKTVELSDKTCPQCQGHLVLKWSRKGKFLSCENFPKCRYAESITTDVICPECKQGKLLQRRNKKGQYFYGCSKFPECRYTSRQLPKESDKPENENPVIPDHPRLPEEQGE